MFSIEAKLEIEKITEAAGLETLEVYSLITSLIDLDLIKGYVSVNRKIIVFSKVDPFPNEINL
ncbi:Transcription-associated recombination protein [Nosema bombycis CQ1]|uniref:Transcription-associated recombination protein n=1 Tax=Nosema bombycis (strain CQ1 / CVCC 102059) TaxID=578461 RepID=R0MD02_NOSB1|nr:Transcription-associated recombination protein [Nosema bombycis CQ1]|eukprot:EOB11905.1 Transcription-associated recombination protein [Nosema bombycis CQ1]